MNEHGIAAAAIEDRTSPDARRLLSSLEDGLPEPVRHPVLVILSGLPGTGKTYFARRLVERVPLAMLESDALRKLLVRSPSYTARESTRLFRAVHETIDGLLAREIPVLLDATNTRESHREQLYKIADRHGASAVPVLMDAPEATVRRRLEERAVEGGRPDRSDADWDVYLKLRAAWEPIRTEHLVVNSSQDIRPAVEEIANEIGRRMREGR